MAAAEPVQPPTGWIFPSDGGWGWICSCGTSNGAAYESRERAESVSAAHVRMAHPQPPTDRMESTRDV